MIGCCFDQQNPRGPKRYTRRHAFRYARVCTNTQDLTAHRDALAPAAVDPNATHVDHRFTGTQRERPGLGKAQAACRNRDTVVVTKLDRLARSLPDSRNIAAIDRPKP